MNGYNSNYYNRNLLNSLSRVIQEDVFRLDSANVDDERKRRLQQAQAAAQQAERDPETGLLKTSGAITGIPKHNGSKTLDCIPEPPGFGTIAARLLLIIE